MMWSLPQMPACGTLSNSALFGSFGSRLPHELREEHDLLARRIHDAMTPPDSEKIQTPVNEA